MGGVREGYRVQDGGGCGGGHTSTMKAGMVIASISPVSLVLYPVGIRVHKRHHLARATLVCTGWGLACCSCHCFLWVGVIALLKDRLWALGALWVLNKCLSESVV